MEPIPQISLKGVVDINKTVHEFREKYMEKAYAAKRTLDARKGNFKDDTEAAAYSDVCTRIRFLESLLESLITMSRYVAVCSHLNDGFTRGVHNMGIMRKDGSIISDLNEDQKDFISQYINKLETIYEKT